MRRNATLKPRRLASGIHKGEAGLTELVFIRTEGESLRKLNLMENTDKPVNMNRSVAVEFLEFQQ